MSWATALLGVHATATLAMTGLIWFVQVVHYPLFRAVPAGAFPDYERDHQRRTTWVVAPLMLVEAAAAVAVASGSTPRVAPWAAWSGVALLAVVWASTFLVQVPLHGRLEGGKDDAVVRRLVSTNWVRTWAWTARGVLAVVMLG